MAYAAFNSNAYLHHIALNTTRPLQLARFYENTLCLEKERISGGWLLFGGNRRILILTDTKNSLGFAGFACQDVQSFKALKRNCMERGIETSQDNKSLFSDKDSFFILDYDGNKIYFGLNKRSKEKDSKLHAPLQHITSVSYTHLTLPTILLV